MIGQSRLVVHFGLEYKKVLVDTDQIAPIIFLFLQTFLDNFVSQMLDLVVLRLYCIPLDAYIVDLGLRPRQWFRRYKFVNLKCRFGCGFGLNNSLLLLSFPPPKP
jgi:hypothetical protein